MILMIINTNSSILLFNTATLLALASRTFLVISILIDSVHTLSLFFNYFFLKKNYIIQIYYQK